MPSFNLTITFISWLVLAAVWSFSVVASAQTTIESATDTNIVPETVQTLNSEGFPSQREVIEQRRESGSALTDRQQERIINLSANISNRLDAVVLRFEKIIERLVKRIEKIEAAGVDTNLAKLDLEAAKISLESTKNTLENIDSQVAEVVGATEPRKLWQELKTDFLKMQSDLRSTQGNLRQSLTKLKNPETVISETNLITQ